MYVNGHGKFGHGKIGHGSFGHGKMAMYINRHRKFGHGKNGHVLKCPWKIWPWKSWPWKMAMYTCFFIRNLARGLVLKVSYFLG